MTIAPERLVALDTITLHKGGHRNFDQGHCAMEVVAWLAGEGHTSAPECASRVLRRFTIGLNDQWDHAQRQRLVPFLPHMVGTAGDGMDKERSYLALDWLVRTHTPVWLDLAGLSAEAQALRDLRQIVDMASAEAAGPVVRAGRERAAAAWFAARDAARDAARHAAWVTAWFAAGDAVVDAAWFAAGDAVVVAWPAARDASWSAAWSAAGDALKPTVQTLQASALDLLDRMIDPAGVTR